MFIFSTDSGVVYYIIIQTLQIRSDPTYILCTSRGLNTAIEKLTVYLFRFHIIVKVKCLNVYYNL